MGGKHGGERAADGGLGENLLHTISEVGAAAGIGMDTVRDVLQAGRDKALDARGRVEDEIRARPLESIAIAAGMGIAIGWLIGRRWHGGKGER